jgi:hypothetical protein
MQHDPDLLVAGCSDWLALLTVGLKLPAKAGVNLRDNR